MGGIALDPKDIIAKLPPGFDYSAIDAALKTSEVQGLPDNVKSALQGVVDEHQRSTILAQPPKPATADVTDVTSRLELDAQQAELTRRTQEQKQGLVSAASLIPATIVEGIHDLTAGISPGADKLTGFNPTPADAALFRGVIKPILSVDAMIAQGKWIQTGLSWISKAPATTRMIESLPQRLADAMGSDVFKRIFTGAAIGGGIDVMRPDVPTGTSVSPLDISGWLGAKLSETTGLDPRIALGVAGAAGGSAIGEVLGGFLTGIQKARTLSAAMKWSPEDLAAVKSALESAGIKVDVNATRYNVADQLFKNLRKTILNETTAGLVSERMAREDHILTELFGSAKIAQADVARVPSKLAGEIPPTPSSLTPEYVAHMNTPAGQDELAGRLLDTPEKVAAFRKQWMTEHPGTPVPNPPPVAPTNPIVSSPVQATEEDARMIAGVFRTNPGGVTIVKGITSTDAIEAAKTRLGISLDHAVVVRPNLTGDGNVATAQFDAILARPNYQYPQASTLGSLNSKLTTRLKAMSLEAVKDVRTPKSVEGFILSDGTPIKGGLRMSDLTKKLRLQQPIVGGIPRPDLALKQASNYVRMELVGDKEFAIELPTRLTQEQFNSLGRSFDAVQMNKVTIHAPDGTTAVLETPLGAQVQDQIAKMVKPQSVTSSLTPKMVQQYGRTGVFTGQAAILPDGTAAEVLSKQGALKGQGAFYRVRESLTGQVLKVNEKNLTILPTTLTAEMQPSQLFSQYLNPEERAALARMRYGIGQGWAEPISTNNDFKQFANSRGYNVESLRGGKVIIAKVNDGMAEPVTFGNMKAAIEFVRHDNSNLPDLTPESIKTILGENVNLGWIGGSGHSPLQGEQIPINWTHLQSALDAMEQGGRGTSFAERVLRPSRSMFEAIDKLYPDLQTRKMYENIQDGSVGMQNFIMRWRSAKGEALPDGIKSLNKIIELAGPKPNTELIYSWSETPKASPEAAQLWAQMTLGEQKSALGLRDWYRSAYSHFGVDASFVEDYMPRYKEFKNQGNAGTLQDWWKMQGGDPLNPPKGMDWVSEMERSGNMDVYEKDAFKVATSYLRGAAHTKFMKAALDDANAMTKMIAEKNPGIASHIGHFIQAVKGTEFPEQNAAIAETFHRLLESLPGEPRGEATRNLANGMVDLLNGAVYSSTQGFRASLAFRNAADAFIMVWPVFGGNGRFSEAIGRAITTAGRDEAIASRAISMSQGRRFDQPAVEQAIKENIPEFIQRLNERGMRMYDSADEFTRSVAYHSAKIRAEDALKVFAREVNGASPQAIEAAKRKLLIDSRMFMQDKQIGDDFLRRAASDPEKAAQFAGKQGSDMTNFNYGRGMQPQWMRSVGGRLFGQFATWPLWYIDYMRRMVGRAGTAGFREEGLRLLARHALINAAILYSGKQVFNIDMSKWASYGSMFWSGGPGFSVAVGASTLMRGLGQVATGSEDPQAQSRVTEAMGQVWNTLPAYVPLYFAGRDVVNMTQAQNGTELLAAALATRPTRDFTMQDRIDRLTGFNQKPFTASSPALEDILNARALGKPTVDLRGAGQALGLDPRTGLQPGTATRSGAQSSSTQSGGRQPLAGVPTATPPGTVSNIPESKPSKGF